MAASRGMAKGKGHTKSGGKKPTDKKDPHTIKYGKGRNRVHGGGATPMR